MVKQMAQKKNQEVPLEIDSQMGLMWADERRLKQMLVNLLRNAVKFTPETENLGWKSRETRKQQEALQCGIVVSASAKMIYMPVSALCSIGFRSCARSNRYGFGTGTGCTNGASAWRQCPPSLSREKEVASPSYCPGNRHGKGCSRQNENHRGISGNSWMKRTRHHPAG